MKTTKLALALLLAASVQSVTAETTPTTFSQAYKAYQQAYQSGTLQEVVDYAKEAYQLGADKFGKQSENTAALAYNLANAYRDAGQYEMALDTYDNVMDLREEIYGEYAIPTLEARLDSYFTYNDYANALKSLSMIEKNAGRLHKIMYSLADFEDENPEDAPSAYYLVGRAMGMTGHMPSSARKAKEILQDGIELTTKTWGDTDIRTLELQYVLALVYKGDYKLPEATERLETLAAKISDEAYASHPWALQAHAALVNIYSQQNKFDKATKHCQLIGKMTPWQENAEPEPLYRRRALYPRTLAHADKTGEVIIKFAIDEEGYTQSPEILDINGDDAFAESALVALSYWRYAPKFVDGKPVVATDNVTKFTFSIYN